MSIMHQGQVSPFLPTIRRLKARPFETVVFLFVGNDPVWVLPSQFAIDRDMIQNQVETEAYVTAPGSDDEILPLLNGRT